MTVSKLDFSYQLPLPPRTNYGVGIIGCGGIVDYAHLPAYKAHHLNVVACYDINREAAQKLAQKHHIPSVAASLEELLADERIQIVDIAVPPWHQLALVEQCVAAGKHMLCQKPLSNTYSEAVKIVKLAREAGLKLAVNQQMRWDVGIHVSKRLISQGALGEPTDARLQVNVRTPWHMWPWIARNPQLEIMFHSIHYLDSMRYLFGDPVRVSSFHTRSPEQTEIGETKTITVLEYDSGLQVLVDANHLNWSDDLYAVYRFLGTSGIIKGIVGLLYDYPEGRPDTLEYHARSDPSHQWIRPAYNAMWIPDAFIGPMASLMEAIQYDGEPLTGGADNLKTLQLVFAAYRSAAEHRAVEPKEIAAEAQ